LQLATSQEQFMAEERQFRTDQRQVNAQNNQATQRLEAQMGQMARDISERKKGEFQTQTIPNPGGHQQLKAVTTLRNGKIIGVDDKYLQMKHPHPRYVKWRR
jgi:hypothetical protein